MLHFSKWKITVILGACLVALYLSLPNVTFLRQSGVAAILPEKTLSLGLDLQGGSYLLLEVDTEAYLREQKALLQQDIRDVLKKNQVDGKRILYTGGVRITRENLSIALKDPSQAEKVASILRRNTEGTLVDVLEDGQVTVALADAEKEKMRRHVVEQSIEIVRRRVDETGTREPDIQRQGDNRILLQVPGLKDPEQLKRLLGKTAKLTFHLVSDKSVTGGAILTPGTIRVKDEDGRPLILKRQAILTGDLLNNATTGFNQYRQPVVNIRFNNLGAKKFADVTRNNVGKPFAIVLDNTVLTAPVIRTPILGGAAEISGNFTVESANDLAILLRAGALPAPIDIVEERTVGASLGADSIAAGEAAILLAVALVIVFMVLSYGVFGVFSVVALMVNLLLIIALLTTLQASLTLPGIAGIVLTMGMAVDANVLIFERIKEEVGFGKTPIAAIDHGFRQAFKTIADANITTLIAAIILFGFGSGPVKGFAVTLSIGILSSMFSAILLTRLMVATWLRKKRPSVLPL